MTTYDTPEVTINAETVNINAGAHTAAATVTAGTTASYFPKFVVTGKGTLITADNVGQEELTAIYERFEAFCWYTQIGAGQGVMEVPPNQDGVRLASLPNYNPHGKYYLDGVAVKNPDSLIIPAGKHLATSIGLGNG